MRQRARRRKTPIVRMRTCVACRQTVSSAGLVRYGIAAEGQLQKRATGGRGAWVCQSGDAAHEALVGDGLRRGLRSRIADIEVHAVLAEREREGERGGKG